MCLLNELGHKIPLKVWFFCNSCKRTFKTRNKYEMRYTKYQKYRFPPHLQILFPLFLRLLPSFMSPCRKRWSPNVCRSSRHGQLKCVFDLTHTRTNRHARSYFGHQECNICILYGTWCFWNILLGDTYVNL